MTVETCFSKFNWLSISIPKGVTESTDEKGAKKRRGRCLLVRVKTHRHEWRVGAHVRINDD